MARPCSHSTSPIAPITNAIISDSGTLVTKTAPIADLLQWNKFRVKSSKLMKPVATLTTTMGQQWLPRQISMSLQRLPIANSFYCRSIAVEGFLEYGPSLLPQTLQICFSKPSFLILWISKGITHPRRSPQQIHPPS